MHTGVLQANEHSALQLLASVLPSVKWSKSAPCTGWCETCERAAGRGVTGTPGHWSLLGSSGPPSSPSVNLPLLFRSTALPFSALQKLYFNQRQNDSRRWLLPSRSSRLLLCTANGASRGLFFLHRASCAVCVGVSWFSTSSAGPVSLYEYRAWAWITRAESWVPTSINRLY